MNNEVYMYKENVKNLNGLQLAVMSAINYIATKNDIYITQEIIQDVLFDEISTKQRDYTNIISAIEYLIDNKYINVKRIYGNGKNKLYVVDSKSVWIDGKYGLFTNLKIDSVKKAMKIKNTKNYDIIKSLFGIACFFDKNKVAYPSIDDICHNYNIDNRTFERHLKLLEENKIIYVVHGNTRCIHNCIMTDHNNYTEYCNKDKAISNYESYRMAYGFVDDKKLKTLKDSRSIKQRYNSFVSGSNYTKEKIEKLYNDCIRYNDFYKDKKYGKDKILDMSVFENINISKDDKTNENCYDLSIDNFIDGKFGEAKIEEDETWEKEFNRIWGDSITDDIDIYS